MALPEYTDLEKRVMQCMAHGLTRAEIAAKIQVRVGDGKARWISRSTVARASRSATDKAVAPGAPITQGIAAMVAQGVISVPFKGQKSTARETALHWLETRIMSCVDWPEFVDLRDAYRAMVKETDA